MSAITSVCCPIRHSPTDNNEFCTRSTRLQKTYSRTKCIWRVVLVLFVGASFTGLLALAPPLDNFKWAALGLGVAGGITGIWNSIRSRHDASEEGLLNQWASTHSDNPDVDTYQQWTVESKKEWKAPDGWFPGN